MSKGEWKGWQNWETFSEAGIVAKQLDFTKEDIIVDHAVGRTTKAIGKCWPIDAAVAYTLMKAGPDASLTKRDMLNQYTRAAAVLMTGKVAWGSLPDPDIPSCGCDEVKADIITLGRPVFSGNENGKVAFNLFTGYSYNGTGTMINWLTEQGVTDDAILSCANVRVKSGTHPNLMDFMAWDYFAPLREYLLNYVFNEKTYESPVNELVIDDRQFTQPLGRSRISTKGECAWANDDRQCRWHDNKTKYNWYMLRDTDDKGGNFHKLWERERVYAGGNHDMFNFVPEWMITPNNVVKFEDVQRTLTQAVDDKFTLKQISASLQRMHKRRDNIVMKIGEGKGAQFKWSDWGWLADMTAYVKNTNSKKRKEGDIANGWIYTKVNSRFSYGHEIAEFVWRPAEEMYDYTIVFKEDNWASRHAFRNLRFPSAEQAQNFLNAMLESHISLGGFYAKRLHDGIEKEPDWSDDKYIISKHDMSKYFEMDGKEVPEDYEHPLTLLNMFRNASPVAFSSHVGPDAKLTRHPIGGIYRVKNKPKPEGNE
tara:strand:+ start:3304 stop:4914 length:1611 start_codon:yes stop_codon:yes gene_type:complete